MKLMILSLFGLMVAIVPSRLEAAPKSYPMVCRGGSGTLGYSGNGLTAMFYFRKAPGRSGNGLNPGECAWMDRAVGAAEPTCLKQRGVEVAAWIFPAEKHNSYFQSQQAAWIRALLNANTYQVFQAYNPGNGDCFVITRVGY